MNKEWRMNTQVESGAPKLEPEENGQVSATGRDQQASPVAGETEGEWLTGLEARLGERIAAEVERRFQSAKDKRWAELERQFGALSDYRQAAEQEQSQAGQGGKEPLPPPEEWALDRARHILAAAGLENDAQVAALARQGNYAPTLEGYVAFLGDLTEMVLRRSGKRPASAATALPPGGQAPPPDVAAEYQRRLKALRPGDVNALMALKREFRQKGLEVY
jgi:hypothetical protein